jgi:uncharacterized membrane protein YfcA
MWNPAAEAAFLGVSGVVAGTASSAGAIGTLISYPVLLAVGISPLAANVTNSVSVVGIGVGSTLGSREELRGTGRRLMRWSTVTCASTVAGVALLLLTPAGFFGWVVPFLIASTAVLLLLQPRISAWRQDRGPGHRIELIVGLGAVGAYNGYFGAASGVMTLALLLLTVEPHLARANALKNALLGISDVVAAVAFALFGPVHWTAAIPLGLGFIAGGAIGPKVTRRVPAHALRIAIAVGALGLALWLLIEAIRGGSG